ncbi:hypothetical protein AVEN_111792-1 [Araneus ventricosus]|uniref:PiggyBac transposable element-derived protein domain-containing protein n=1 Tax=Araneus ventricosus TaxID=182803 RepID=A0A4Y2HPX1_ARAVE|nr:hypothetical protein AVEN_111792-1 [Araneus ventricosus]
MSSLLQQNFFCCGTIQQRRKFFLKSYLMDDKQMKTGDSDFACSEEISVVKWRDRGEKSVISTMHDPNVTSSVLRTNKQGARERVQCPVAIKNYNKKRVELIVLISLWLLIAYLGNPGAGG